MKQLEELNPFHFNMMINEDCGMFIIDDLSALDHVVKRIFVVSPDAPTIRGDHAHLDCWQTLICIRGSIDVMVDDGSNKKTFILKNYGHAITVPPGFWSSQNYFEQSSLMVLCSHLYNEGDYLRDYNKFLNFKGQK